MTCGTYALWIACGATAPGRVGEVDEEHPDPQVADSRRQRRIVPALSRPESERWRGALARLRGSRRCMRLGGHIGDEHGGDRTCGGSNPSPSHMC